jgi:dihydroneopterin aldolase
VRVSVEDLTIDAIIGVLPSEREKPQRILASAKIDYGYKTAGDFVDYAAVADLITARLIDGRFGLLEDALEAIVAEILQLNKSIERVKLTLEKPDISLGFRAAVSLRRDML